MARLVFIRITESQLNSADIEAAEWVMIDKNDPQQIIERGTLDAPPALGIGDKAIVCIPASKMLLNKVALPNSNINRLRKIVPFTFEEIILDDVEEVHFAIANLEKDKNTTVAVIQKELLDSTLRSIETIGLSPTVMIPDCLCIPLDEKTWTIFVENELALVRVDSDTGFSCTTDLLKLMLTQYLKDENVIIPEKIKSYNVPLELQQEISSIVFEDDVEFSTYDVSGNTEMLFLEQYLENTPGLNILQGSYSRRQKMGQHFRPWIPAVGLFAAWVVLALFIDIINYRQLSSELTALNAQKIKLYKTAFPKARKIINPRAQMEANLKQLRKKAGKNSSSASTMISFVATVLKKHKLVGIKNLRYSNSNVNIDIQLKNLQVLDELKSKLTNNGIWKVEVLSATSRDKFVESRIQIRG